MSQTSEAAKEPRSGRRGLATIVAASASSASSARRDPGLGVGLFLLPLFVMVLVGIAMGGYSEPVFTVGVLDRAGTAASLRLAETLDADEAVRVRSWDDEERMRYSVYRGRLHAGIVIPEGWDGRADVDLYASAAGVGAIVVRAIAEAKVAHAVDAGARTVPSRVAGGGIESSPPIGFHYTAPSNVVMFLILNGLMASTGMLMLRQRGIAKRLLATPARTWELLALLIIGPAQVMIVQAAFLILVTGLAFGVPWGDPVGVLLLTTTLVLVGLGISLFMTGVYRSPQQAFSLSPLLVIGIGMIGGCMWPLSIVPPWLRDAGHVFPTAWAMDGYLQLIFERADVVQILPQAGALLGMAIVLGGIGTLRLRSELAR